MIKEGRGGRDEAEHALILEEGARLEALKVQRVGQNHRCQPVRELGPPAGAKIQAKWRSSMPDPRVCLALISGVHPRLPSS